MQLGRSCRMHLRPPGGKVCGLSQVWHCTVVVAALVPLGAAGGGVVAAEQGHLLGTVAVAAVIQANAREWSSGSRKPASQRR